MGAPELLIEHIESNKSKRKLRVKKSSGAFLIGSSRSAQLKLSGKDISGCHAALKYRAPYWYVCDLNLNANSSSALLDQKKFTETKIEGQHILQIGSHQIRLISSSNHDPLFSQSKIGGKWTHQQVVIRSATGVIETMIIEKDMPLILNNAGEKLKLVPPTSGEWVVTEVGRRMIQQRLVFKPEAENPEKFRFDQDVLKPMGIFSAIFVLLFFGFKLAKPSETKVEQVIDKKSMDMIFNAKSIMKKREESKKLAQAAKVKRGGNEGAQQNNVVAKSSPDVSQAPQVTQKTTVALNNIRQSGLKSLIGKIAKRASKQGIMIAATGVTPEQQSGRAFFSHGKSSVGGGGGAIKEGPSYKLGGVGTKGLGGGASNVGDGTSLVGGKAGQGEVALVDDETVIEGGLDKDVIADVIKHSIGQIRYCYERQLSADRNLYGKLIVKFDITGEGGVAGPRVDQSTLKNAMVEGCIMRRLSALKFPHPKGGTVVRVTYPFLFKALD